MSFDMFVRSVLMKTGATGGGGGSITYVGGDVVDDSNPATSSIDLTPTLPTHAADDFAILFFYRKESSVEPAITTPSGWTKLDENFTESTHKTATFYRKLTSSSETNPTVTSTGDTGANGKCLVSVVVFRGVDTSTPFDVTYSNASHFLGGALTDDSATFAPLPTITTTTNNCAIYVVQGSTGSAWDSQSPPSGYTETWQYDLSNLGGQDAYILDAGTAGSNAPEFQNVSDGGVGIQYGGYIFALRPA